MAIVNKLFSFVWDPSLVPFAFGCAVTSVLFLLVDYGYFVAQGRRDSMLNITYRGNNLALIAITWFLGALVVGYFAIFVSIFQASKLSMLSLGILWPVVMAKLIQTARSHIEGEEPDEDED